MVIKKIEYAEKILDYKFKDSSLLKASLTQESYRQVDSYANNYQRNEFLGDAVIEAMIYGIYFRKYFDENNNSNASLEAKNFKLISDLKEKCVCNNLQKFILVNKRLHNSIFHNCSSTRANIESFEKEVNSVTEIYGIRGFEKIKKAKPKVNKVLSDVFEAIVGAVYLDCGSDLNKTWIVYSKLALDYLKIYANYDDLFAKKEIIPNVDLLSKFYLNRKKKSNLKEQKIIEEYCLKNSFDGTRNIENQNKNLFDHLCEITSQENPTKNYEELKIPINSEYEKPHTEPKTKPDYSNFDKESPAFHPSKPFNLSQNCEIDIIQKNADNVENCVDSRLLIPTMQAQKLFYQAVRNIEGKDIIIYELEVKGFTDEAKKSFMKTAMKEMNRKYSKLGNSIKPRILEIRKN